MIKNNNRNENAEQFETLENNYAILIKLGSGSFGSVWRLMDRKTKKEYAVKIEDLTNSRLKNEHKIYTKLSSCAFGIPKVKRYFESEKYCYLIMELLGKNLEQLFVENKKSFSLNVVLKFGIDMIDILEQMHINGYIHRDIKPNNFIIGINDDNIYITDFGLSKKYIQNSKHICMKVERSLVGTARYASLNVHEGVEPSRRDDLESVGYMLIYFLKGKLPWQGLKKKNENDVQIDLIEMAKCSISLDELCSNIPNCFKLYLVHCRKLIFDETPDYSYLRNLFLKCAKNLELDLKYNWNKQNKK